MRKTKNKAHTTSYCPVREAALQRLKQLFPNGRPRFGDKRDGAESPADAGCTSARSFSTMRSKAA